MIHASETQENINFLCDSTFFFQMLRICYLIFSSTVGVTPTALHHGTLTRPQAFSRGLDTCKIPLTRPVLTIHSPLTAVLELSV